MKTLPALALLLTLGASPLAVAGRGPVLTAATIEDLVEKAIWEQAVHQPGRVDLVVVQNARPTRLPAGEHQVGIHFRPGEDFAGPTRAELRVTTGGRTFKRLWFTARVKRVVPVLRVKRRLRAGHVIRRRDVTVDEAVAERVAAGALARVEDAIGRKLRSPVQHGRALTAALIAAPDAVRRGDLVTLVSGRGTLQVTAPGRVAQTAALGATIRVQNLASRRSVLGRVEDPDTVRVGTP